MCDSPSTIHSASDLPTPGPSFTHTAAADQRPLTSGVSPRIGIPSGVSEMRPLIAYFTPTDSSPTISGIRSSASCICGSKSAWVNGNSVGESAAASIDGISSGSWWIERCAYEPISRLVPSWRSYMNTSMSRTIGYSIAFDVPAKRGTGPTSIIWCTIGVERDVRPRHLRRGAGSRHRRRSRRPPPRSCPATCARAGSGRPRRPCPSISVFGEDRQRAGLDRALAHQRPGPERVDDTDPRACRSRRRGSTRRCTARAP